ncbi:TrmB family transcriptional regulator [Halocatena salina]|uniref:TrmB family transcriptional regulator n=1 Tax=Halocatena salina TaxID=2934340 RepID=A0A8U0A664_9EURY|nr:TrmB family transcriptional regulator [Halocatena salina]UPM44562.1 TrmB family transcriptional regulator [Halocatena salina]
MNRDALRRALENADLTAYQAKAYLTLIDNGRLSAVDVAEKATIPTSQIYKTLRSLEGMGFIEIIEQDTLHAEPRDLTAVQSQLRKRGALLSDAADELEERWTRPTANEHRVSVVKHAETVIERVRDRLSEVAVSAELSVTMEQLITLGPDLMAAAERGVVVHVSVYDDDDVTQRCRDADLLDSPIEIRVASIPGPFLAILDRRSTYFTPNDRADETYGVLIEDEILSFINHWYFRTCLWDVSPTVDAVPSGRMTYLSLEEFLRDIGPLYHQGATISVTIVGCTGKSDRTNTVHGEISGLFYPGVLEGIESPSLGQLSTFSTVFIDTDETRYSVGSWGAVFEDIEALTIRIDDIVFPSQPSTDGTERSEIAGTRADDS